MKNNKLALDERRKVIYNLAISNVFKDMATLTSEEQLEIIKRVQFAIEYDGGERERINDKKKEDKGFLKQIEKDEMNSPDLHSYQHGTNEDEWYTGHII